MASSDVMAITKWSIQGPISEKSMYNLLQQSGVASTRVRINGKKIRFSDNLRA
jgi:hypothetical protein